jgi:S-DNA-T family DNA segregation ATPase FtsK/SpoIIIE
MIDSKFFDCFNHSVKHEESVMDKEELERIFQSQLFIDADVKGVYCGTAATRYDVEVKPHYIKFLLGKVREFNSIFNTNGCRISQNGKYVCIEIPNRERGTYGFADCVESLNKIENCKDGLFISIGEALDGSNITYDLATMPHFLIGGQTGSGKSVFAHNVLLSLLLQYTKEELELILIDPKAVEFGLYKGVPQISSIITESKVSTKRLALLCEEMDSRYSMFAKYQCRDIASYNQIAKERLPRIVVYIEEMADLILSEGDKVVDDVSRLTAKARASGIHVILSTQRPESEVMSGMLKSNFQCRAGFATVDKLNSRMILGSNGAETLRGNGDGLFKSNDGQKLTRFQSAYITEGEIKRAVSLLKTE